MPRALPHLLIGLTLLCAACSGSSDTATDANDAGADGTPTTLSLTPTTTDGGAGSGESPPSTAGPDAPPATVPDQSDLEPNAIVERVVDGDTIIVEINDTRERVRP